MIRCKEVATLLATDQLDGQSGWRRAQVHLHLTLCSPCRRFRRQLRFLRSTAASLDARFDEEVGSDFADRVHERLTRA